MRRTYVKAAWCGVGPLAFAMLVACSSGGPGSLDGDGGIGGDGGRDGGGGGACPATAPTVGATCALASSVQCTYSYPGEGPACQCCAAGSNSLYVCQGGRWQELATPSGITPPNVCPSTMPVDGSSCNPCQNHTCSYTCATSNNDPGEATCTGGRWVVSHTNVACPTDAGVDSSIGDGGPG